MHHHSDHCHTAANVSHGLNNNASALNTVWENSKSWSITPAFLEEEKAKQQVMRHCKRMGSKQKFKFAYNNPRHYLYLVFAC